MMTADPRIQILLVEDDPDDVLLITEALRETGIPSDLHVATDGEAAMDFFHRRDIFVDCARFRTSCSSTSTCPRRTVVGFSSTSRRTRSFAASP